MVEESASVLDFEGFVLIRHYEMGRDSLGYVAGLVLPLLIAAKFLRRRLRRASDADPGAGSRDSRGR